MVNGVCQGIPAIFFQKIRDSENLLSGSKEGGESRKTFGEKKEL
jgi:hypothetical protein